MQSKDRCEHSYISPNSSKINYSNTITLNRKTTKTQDEQLFQHSISNQPQLNENSDKIKISQTEQATIEQPLFYHQYSYIYFTPIHKKIIKHERVDVKSEHKAEIKKQTVTYRLSNNIIEDTFEHINPLTFPQVEEIYHKHLRKTKRNINLLSQIQNHKFLSSKYNESLYLKDLLNNKQMNKRNGKDQTHLYFELKTSNLPIKQEPLITNIPDKPIAYYVETKKIENMNNIRLLKIKDIKYTFLQTELYKRKFDTESNDKQLKTGDIILQDYDKTIIKDFIITGYLPKIMKNSIYPFDSSQADDKKAQNPLNILKDSLEYFNTKLFLKNELSLYA